MPKPARAESRRAVAREPRAMLGMAIQAVAFFLVWTIHTPGAVPAWQGSAPVDRVETVVATGVGLASVWLLIAATRHLGRHWALAARTIEHHELITSGPYGLVRHPIYLAVGGFVVVTGLMLAPIWVLLVACVIYVAGTYIRLRAEEKLLTATFGPAFDDYRRRVPALIPNPIALMRK